MNLIDLKKIIRNIPNFPKPGIKFKDITPILSNPKMFKDIIKCFAEIAKKYQITAIVAPEARGFIFGSALAYDLNIKFIPVRKKGKLPYKTYQTEYQLEYGTDILEMHQDALVETDKVLIIDDLVATSGTIQACIDLVAHSKASVVCISTLIALKEFKQQQQFGDIPFISLIEF